MWFWLGPFHDGHIGQMEGVCMLCVTPCESCKTLWGTSQLQTYGNHRPARADSSPPSSFCSTCRESPSMKGVDKEKQGTNEDGQHDSPHPFNIFFSYLVFLIPYFVFPSISLIWKCAFFGGGEEKPQQLYCYFQKYRRIWTVWQIRKKLHKKIGNFCLLVKSLCVCQCKSMYM